MPHFAFKPSEMLLNDILTGIQNRNSSEPLYPQRDKIVLQLNEEIINVTLTELVRRFPASDKRDTAEKLAGYVKSTVNVLLKQLLNKANNETVRKSIQFSEDSLYKAADGSQLLGAPLDASVVTNLKHTFAEIKAGNDINKAVLTEQFKQMADGLIRHLMIDFNKTLDLGMFMRKAADIGTSAVTKAVHIGVDKLIPNLSKEELKAVAEHYDSLLFN